ncbi:TetR family transcriptional regulator [Nitratireductor sp. CAU 1489]|uniref:TetR family transcriptional regulator n=1 Tax=Nitratireductor arenosus TaxID=2682096 RepID=A0A844QB49_9HYPH|nr:TetR/AcrR family transcriptional regulator [Nitratireductor arenosus]MVA96432.1 TetR family transcriptional regulator [Nitratireductor arenosus]
MKTAQGADEARRERIVEGAVKVFLAYGFQRTTMDDIARAADLSRPALYLDFKNKGDIYRAIAARKFAESTLVLERALNGDGDIEARLMDGLEQSLFSMMRVFFEAPHGAEILDAKNSLAAVEMAEWRRRFIAVIATALAAEAAARSVDLEARGFTADTLAGLLLDGIEGMKARVEGPDEWAPAARRLVRLVGLALQP